MSPVLTRVVVVLAFMAAFGCAGSPTATAERQPLSIVQSWQGDFPVAALDRLPPAQRDTRVGVLGEADAFAAVWQAFKPGEAVPAVDFAKHIVVFSRNLRFYNRTSIAKVTLRDGVAEIIAIETLSATPIEAKVAMALAVIPRQGVNYIEAGEQRITVNGG
jgi:hypothetical protein